MPGDELDADLEALGGSKKTQGVTTHEREEMESVLSELAKIDETLAQPLETHCPKCGENVAAEDLEGGVGTLLKRKEGLRNQLKGLMDRGQVTRVIDELSRYEAKLQPSFSHDWDVPKLEHFLEGDPEVLVQVVAKTVDDKIARTLIEAGTLDETKLRKGKVLKDKLRSVSLVVRPMK